MTAPETMKNCPIDETLAAFIDGRLDGDAHHRVIAHLAECPECRGIVVAARELEASGEESAGQAAQLTELRRRRFYAPAFVAAIAASFAVIVFMPALRDWVAFKTSGGLSPVVRAYESGSQRTVQSRPSGFVYRDFKGPTRGPGDQETEDAGMLPMQVAEARLEDAASKGSWKELRALALANLFLGRRDDALRAIDLATRAGGDSDSGFLNDAAAVYLEQARFTGLPKDRLRALTAAERAWNRAKTPESVWNRALAYEVSGREAEAQRAWQEYLAIDGSSPWAQEARERHLERQRSAAPLP